MILDRLEHASRYAGLEKSIREALDYLRSVDFSRLPEGRHTIDGDRLFALVQRYRPKPPAEATWEAHRRYADVQYVIEGSERIGYAPLVDGVAVTRPYDAEKDVVFFDVRGDLFALPAGSFAVFMPQDIHAPGLLASDSAAVAEVRKVVVKCSWAG
jgi:biofilm protein TabA